MSSCAPEFKHTLILSQSATEPKDNVTISAVATDHAPYEHLDANNYIGFIMVTAVIIVVLSLWGILSFRARRSEKKRGEGEMEDKEKLEKLPEEWLKEPGRQDKARTEKILDAVQMNDIECGEECKRTNSATP
jgi:flagellar biosynthesis/type III secretory pathway M-ring protein FliF/YscJ